MSIGSITAYPSAREPLRGVCRLPCSSSLYSCCFLPYLGFPSPLGIYAPIRCETQNTLTHTFRWLISHGRKDEALQVLACIEAKALDDPYITTQHDEIQFSIQYEREEAIRWRDLLRGTKSDGTKTLRRLLLGAGTQAMQQFQGESCNTLLFLSFSLTFDTFP